MIQLLFFSDVFFQPPTTWRIIPVSKWLVTPIYKPFSPFGRGLTLLRGLTNHDHKHHIFIISLSKGAIGLHPYGSCCTSFGVMSKVTTFGGPKPRPVGNTRGEVLRCWGNPGATAGVTSNYPKICGFYYTWSQVDVVVSSPFPQKNRCFFSKVKGYRISMHFKAIAAI